jgi:hypothetical protein
MSAKRRLHAVSDATGDRGAARPRARGAVPDQEFLEIRHPRVETVADLRLAVQADEGAARCRRPRSSSQTARHDARLTFAKLLHRPPGTPDRGRGEGLGAGSARRSRRRGRRQQGVLPADVGDRVRREVRYGVGSRLRRRASSSSAFRAPRRRRSRSTSATSATRPRTCRVKVDPPPELFRSVRPRSSA